MATFLQLAQAVARESRTITGVQPVTTVNQTGRLAEIVESVRDAWRELQNLRASWFWLDQEWTGQTVAGTRRYTDGSFSLVRWAAWKTNEDDPLTSYRLANGVSEEQRLLFLPYPIWRVRHDIGSEQEGAPTEWSVSPSGEICLGPTPDDTFVLRGTYRKAPQELVNDGDEPDMPERFHNILVWSALMKIHEYDEADGAVPYLRCQRQYQMYLDALNRDQMPEIRLGHRRFD